MVFCLCPASNDPPRGSLYGVAAVTEDERSLSGSPSAVASAGGDFALCTEAGSPQQAGEEREGDVRPLRRPEASPGRTEPIS